MEKEPVLKVLGPEGGEVSILTGSEYVWIRVKYQKITTMIELTTEQAEQLAAGFQQAAQEIREGK